MSRVLLLFLNGCLIFSAKAQLYWLPFEELFDRSVMVVEGRVISQQSFWDDARQNIYTANNVEVSRVYKGLSQVAASVTVITPGGIVDDQMQLVSECVQHSIGDRGLFCLVPCLADIPVGKAWEHYGWAHGFFAYQFEANAVAHPFHASTDIAAFRKRVERLTGEAVIWKPDELSPPFAKDRMPPSISSFSPTSISAGTGSVLTINGSGFGTTPGTVRFLNSNTGSPFDVDAGDISSWSDNLIQVVVPSTLLSSSACAGTGPITVVDASNNSATSATNLEVTFGYTNFVFSGNKVGAKLVNNNSMGGMTFTFSTTLCNSSNQNAVNAVGRALREWRCVSGVNWRLSTSTTTANSPASDGINIITYDVGSPLPSGVLGVATSYYSACSHGGGFHWRVNEIDINLRQSGVTWYFCDSPTVPSGSFDFQSVVFHEFGHGHQLQHIIDNTAVMHRSIGPGQARRVLNANEESGADYVLSLPPNPCGPGPMTLLSHPACLGLTPPSACNSAGSCTAPLPVELIYFRARPTLEGVVLNWETATERENDFFTVERSADARHFEPIGRIRGAGNAAERRKYEYLDPKSLPGLNYYRLWQTDYDGTSTLLSTTYAEVDAKEIEALRVFPNPLTEDELNLVITEDIQLEGGLALLFDALGREVMRQKLSSEHLRTIHLAPYRLPAGPYVLRVFVPESLRWLGPVRLWKP
jgi:hypothetical protein